MKDKTRLWLAYFAKSLLLVMAVGLAIFALLSGAEDSGTFKNIPNALPWIVLIIFVCIAFRWQILGGILIILFGVFTILFFSAFQVLWILFLISLPLILLGFFLTLLIY